MQSVRFISRDTHKAYAQKKAILYSEHRVLFMLHAQCYICSSLRGVYCVGTRLFFLLIFYNLF